MHGTQESHRRHAAGGRGDGRRSADRNSQLDIHMSSDPKDKAGAKHTEEQEQAGAWARAQHLPSANEPPGSDIGAGDAGPAELPPLVLSDISPDTMVVGSGTFTLTVTGSGFIPACVVVFDDADTPTTFVSPTELHADCPVMAAAAVVDVEVHRGEDLSDVLSFEFTAVAREGREKKEPVRKPKKDTPSHKRLKGRK
jgi:hypothetical protein